MVCILSVLPTTPVNTGARRNTVSLRRLVSWEQTIAFLELVLLLSAPGKKKARDQVDPRLSS
jgi:hypothetical protein